MSDVSWNCEVSDFPAEGLTVGSLFKLTCGGTDIPGFNSQTLGLELAKADRYRLRILENRKSTSSSVELIVTSYVPGETNLKEAILSDGTHRVLLNGIHFEVKSVIPQGQEAKPVPPFAPVGLMWPTSTLVSIGAAIFAIVLSIAYFVHRRHRRAKFKKWLADIRTPLSPFDQLGKDLRLAMKERNPSAQIAELERMTRFYLSREFNEPLMNASSRRALSIIIAKSKSRDRNKQRERLAPLVIRLFGEFERVAEALSKSQISSSEALNVTLPQVQDLVREFAETIRRDQASGQKGGR